MGPAPRVPRNLGKRAFAHSEFVGLNNVAVGADHGLLPGHGQRVLRVQSGHKRFVLSAVNTTLILSVGARCLRGTELENAPVKPF